MAKELNKKYCYDYPHPAVTTDIVIFTVKDGALQTLLIQRGIEPFKNFWAIPGGFVQEDEDIDTCASRELIEETGAKAVKLRQFGAYGAFGRDPREHVITIAYIALIKAEDINIQHGSDAKDAKWFKFQQLPELAFDHGVILKDAHKELIQGIYDLGGLTVFNLLDDNFTMPQIQTYFEAILFEKLDRRNFSKQIKDKFPIKDTGQVQRDGPHRPSKLYFLP
jgi:8-oxo-dGTP diphosphatase